MGLLLAGHCYSTSKKSDFQWYKLAICVHLDFMALLLVSWSAIREIYS